MWSLVVYEELTVYVGCDNYTYIELMVYVHRVDSV